MDWVDAGRKLEINNGVHFGIKTMVMDVTPAGYGVALSFVNPIPITEDLLIKFGFEFNNRWDWLDLLSEYAIKVGDHYYGKRPAEYGFLEDAKIVIRYVHQLQNICFALTGEELTIKSNTNDKA